MRNPLSDVIVLTDSNAQLPKGISFFDDYLDYYVNETLQIGGEAAISLDPMGNRTGLYIYDPVERSGTVFTKEREVFDFFYGYRPHSTLFSEMKTDYRNEKYYIYSVDLKTHPPNRDFKYEVKVIEEDESEKIERYMIAMDPKMNRKWVRVAFANGDRCFTVELDDSIAGLGWLSLVHGVGRVHSLLVTPMFRGKGIGRDLLVARLMWLRAKRAMSAFSEIAELNLHSAAIAMGEGMKPSGAIYQYFKKS